MGLPSHSVSCPVTVPLPLQPEGFSKEALQQRFAEDSFDAQLAKPTKMDNFMSDMWDLARNHVPMLKRESTTQLQCFGTCLQGWSRVQFETASLCQSHTCITVAWRNWSRQRNTLLGSGCLRGLIRGAALIACACHAS